MSENAESTENNNDTATESVVYELGYHLLSSVGEDNLTDEVNKIKGEIEKNEGVSFAEETPSVFRLLYTIVRSVGGKREKYDTSYFGWIKFELPIGAVRVLKEELDKNENLLRFLLIKTVREDTRAPKRVLQEKTSEKEPEKESIKTKAPVVAKVVKEEGKPAKSVSEEELDRTIEELIVE